MTSELRNILMAHWDPIGVSDVPEACDEYDSYLHPLLAILDSDGGAADVAEYLVT